MQHQAGGKVAGRREDGAPADSAKGVDPQVSIAQVQPDVSELVDGVSYAHERVVLTSRGHSEAALVSMEDYERLRQEEEAPAGEEQMPELAVRFAWVDELHKRMLESRGEARRRSISSRARRRPAVGSTSRSQGASRL